MRHSVGHTLTQAGSSWFSTRFAQKLHFSAVLRVRIDEQLIVRTGFHARPAADARLRVEVNDAVAAFEEGVGRTDARARCFDALVAQDGEEEPPGIRKRSLLDGLDPAAIHADRDLMFGFAGNRARVTADALSQIYGEPVIGHRYGPTRPDLMGLASSAAEAEGRIYRKRLSRRRRDPRDRPAEMSRARVRTGRG